jgi:hypothetical protein
MRNRPIAGKYLQHIHVSKIEPYRQEQMALRIASLGGGLRKPGVQRATYGFTGSLSVSKKSSILLVCSLIASSGLGSLLESPLLGPPNEVWPPKL